jgi:uncharacterized protein YtpQ (UPF0354 family)
MSIADAPENDWSHAARIVFPALRPPGTAGVAAGQLDRASLAAEVARGRSEPVLDDGPAGLIVVYLIPAGGFDAIVNAEHLVTWAVEVAELRDHALRNLAVWSARASWTDEVSGERRLVSSDTGDGWDAVRILLPEVREHLANELAPTGRVLVGLPERHLLIAGALADGDDEFGGLFGEFVVQQSAGADEPIDRRVFELVDGELTEFAAQNARG